MRCARGVLLRLLAWAAGISCANAQVGASPPERQLLLWANEARGRVGAAPLMWDPALARAAMAHAQRMLREPGELSHQYAGEAELPVRAARAGARFRTVSENLARRAENAGQIEQVWMSTVVHRRNILDPTLNSVGISVLEVDGLLYAVEDFSRTVPVMSLPAIEVGVAQALSEQGVRSVAVPDEARGICASPNATPGGVKLVVQWESSEPTELPPALLQQLVRRRYNEAVVVACPGRQTAEGFAVYKVAVLLY